jgi:hypothetical protein
LTAVCSLCGRELLGECDGWHERKDGMAICDDCERRLRPVNEAYSVYCYLLGRLLVDRPTMNRHAVMGYVSGEIAP